jgi:hypothetical protein
MMALLSLIVTLVAMAVLSGATWLLLSAPFHWLAICFMASCRPVRVLSWSAAIFLAIWAAVALFLPIGEGAIIGMLLAFFLTPWPARWWVRVTAFRADPAESRASAALVRNRTLERLGNRKRVTDQKSWPDYIVDVERGRRAAAYELPMSRAG